MEIVLGLGLVLALKILVYHMATRVLPSRRASRVYSISLCDMITRIVSAISLL